MPLSRWRVGEIRPLLILALQGTDGRIELLDAGQEPRPGIRSQIAVVDYNGDGKLDLLLGDFCTYLHVKKDLTPERRREFEKISAEVQGPRPSEKGRNRRSTRTVGQHVMMKHLLRRWRRQLATKMEPRSRINMDRGSR